MPSAPIDWDGLREQIARSLAPPPTDRHAVLAERALRLASARDDQSRAEPDSVEVRVGARRVAIDFDSIVEIARIGAWTPLPGAPRSLLGVCSLRGHVVPLLDLHHLLEEPSPTGSACIVVLGDARMEVGLPVDQVGEPLPLAPAPRRPGPRGFLSLTDDGLTVVDGRRLLLDSSLFGASETDR